MYTIFISNIYYDLQSFNFNLNLKLKILSHLKRSPISYENLFVVKFHWQILYKCRNTNCQLPIKLPIANKKYKRRIVSGKIYSKALFECSRSISLFVQCLRSIFALTSLMNIIFLDEAGN